MSAATASTTPIAAAVAATGTPRVRHIHDLSVLFPECPALSNSAGRMMAGFKDPGAGVPTRLPTFIQESSFMEEFIYFLNCDHLWMLTLTGPTGCGKSERVLDFYSRLNIPVLRVAATGDTRMWDLVGSKDLANDSDSDEVSAVGSSHSGTIRDLFGRLIDAIKGLRFGTRTRFIPGPLYKAMKYGYPCLIDEVYRLPSRLTSKLHTIRDRGELYVEETGETLRAKKGFKLIMTANQTGMGDTTGFYPGDEVQDAAFLNGSPTIECNYPVAEIEQMIVKAALVKAHPAFATEPALADYPKNMVAVANAVRSVFVGTGNGTDQRIELPFSTRHLVWWADAFVRFKGTTSGVHPLYKALDFVMSRRGCEATRVTIDGLLLAHFSISRSDKI